MAGSPVSYYKNDALNVELFGAAGDGFTDSTEAIQAAVDACIAAGGGVVYIPAGTFNVSETVTAELPDNVTVLITGAGYQATTIRFTGAGDCLRMYNPNAYVTGANISWRSGVTGLTIDGTSASASAPSTGLHVGDIGLLKLDLCIQNFTYGTISSNPAIGLLIDNTVTWTEESDVRATLINCTQHVVFNVTTGTASFGYGNFDFTIFAGTNQQDGVVLLNGANMYHGKLRIRGNFTGGASATTAAVLRLHGVYQAFLSSNISASHLDIQVECNNGTHTPQTINLDHSVGFCFIVGCYGIMDFAYGPNTFATATFQVGQITFSGIVDGDTTLGPAGAANSWSAIGAPIIYSDTPAANVFQLNFPTCLTDFFSQVLAGSWTLAINYAGLNNGKTLGTPQRVTIVLTQAASGGPYTVTWPHTATPSTTTPTIKWAGGTAPTMSTGASAVDVYDLETIDGATWYGRATQNVS